MDSITKRLKENILNGCKEEVIYSRKEIKDFLQADYGMVFEKQYQETHLAVSLAFLVKKGKLISCERGKYKRAVLEGEEKQEKNSSEQEKRSFELTKELVKESVQRECDYLKKVTSDMKFSLASLQKEDINDVLLIKELIEYLESFQLL